MEKREHRRGDDGRKTAAGGKEEGTSIEEGAGSHGSGETRGRQTLIIRRVGPRHEAYIWLRFSTTNAG